MCDLCGDKKKANVITADYTFACKIGHASITGGFFKDTLTTSYKVIETRKLGLCEQCANRSRASRRRFSLGCALLAWLIVPGIGIGFCVWIAHPEEPWGQWSSDWACPGVVVFLIWLIAVYMWIMSIKDEESLESEFDTLARKLIKDHLVATHWFNPEEWKSGKCDRYKNEYI